MNWKNLSLLVAGIVIGVLLVHFYGIFADERESLARGAGTGFWIGVGAIVAMTSLNMLIGLVDMIGNALARKS